MGPDPDQGGGHKAKWVSEPVSTSKLCVSAEGEAEVIDKLWQEDVLLLWFGSDMGDFQSQSH